MNSEFRMRPQATCTSNVLDGRNVGGRLPSSRLASNHHEPHEPGPLVTSVRSSTFSVAALFLLAVACGDSGPKIGPPSALSSTGSGQTAAAGRPLTQPLEVRITDAQGTPLPRVTVAFAVTAGGGSVSAANVDTDAQGAAATVWTLGREAGTAQSVTATVAKRDGTSLTATFTATARAGDPATLARIRGDAQQGGTSTALQDSLVVRVADEFGNPIEGVTVTWTAQGFGAVTPATAVTDAGGLAAASWTLGDMLGAGTVVASAASLATQTFSATAVLAITGITPALLTPGATVTITGVNFNPAAAANGVTIAGNAATVQSATATAVTAVLPASLPCRPAGNVTVALVSSGVRAERRHPARTTEPRTIGVGQLLIGSASDPLSCVELPPEGGRYLIAVSNTSSSPPNATALRLRALTETAATAVTEAVAASAPHAAHADAADALARRARHRTLLESGTREDR